MRKPKISIKRILVGVIVGTIISLSSAIGIGKMVQVDLLSDMNKLIPEYEYELGDIGPNDL